MNDHPTTMGLLPDGFSFNLTHDENILAQYLKDCEAGLYLYDQFRTDDGETYNIECRTFWIELRHRAALATLDYVNATNKYIHASSKSDAASLEAF